MDTRIILTDNGAKLLTYLQENDKVWVGKDLGEATQIKGVYPVINSLVRNSLVEYVGEIEREVIDSRNNKTVIRPYKTYQLTDKGRAFII